MSNPTMGSGESASRSLDSRPRAGTLLGQYELIREVGRGGMAMVFLARDTRLARLVAIKILSDPRTITSERFLTEARATARCKHENIVQIHDVGEQGAYSYMVLEYLEGETLRSWLMRRRRVRRGHSAADPGIPVSRAVELMIPVVRALCCAHGVDIVHRDLKPENIFLTSAGMVKVLDFGIARMRQPSEVEPTLAEPGGVQLDEPSDASIRAGTLQYMAPEQLRGDPVDRRCDVWAMGIILFELLAGAHPLAPFSAWQMESVLDDDAPMPQLAEQRPELGAIGAVVDRCLRKSLAERTDSAQLLLDKLELLARSQEGATVSKDQPPFLGLTAFQAADSRRFFGRERDVTKLVVMVRHQPLVALVGPSGAGKSSLVRAGLGPALKQTGEGWDIRVVRPGRHPLAVLCDVMGTLAPTGENAPTDARSVAPGATGWTTEMTALREHPGLFGRCLRAHARRRVQRLLLFVDQFEELYTQTENPADRETFLSCLEGVADDIASPLRLILTLRSDFLDRVADDRRFMERVTTGLRFLGPVEPDGLREALVLPVHASNHRFESEAIVDDMLAMLNETPCPLPLLQFTGARLWELRDREHRVLTLASYESIGGIAGALSVHADSVMGGMSARDQTHARSLLVRLVTAERTRAIARLDELCDVPGETEAIRKVLQRLATARLVVIDDSHGAGTTVELVHESLIDRWPALTRWLDESSEDAVFRDQLRTAAGQWDSGNRTDGLLWTGQSARAAERYLERHRASGTEHLARRDEQYLAAVVALARRKRLRQRQIVFAAFATLTVITVVLAYFVMESRRQARLARNGTKEVQQQQRKTELEAMRARNATRLARAAEMRADPTLSLALLREVEPDVPLPKIWATAVQGALNTGVARVVLTHDTALAGASFNADGSRIVTGGRDGLVRIWSADGLDRMTADYLTSEDAPVVLRDHQGAVLSVVFSPDGQRVMSTSTDGTARVWNANGLGEPLVLRGHGDHVYASAFSRNGALAITASEDRTVRVWHLDGSQQPIVLRAHRDAVLGAALAPSGLLAATAGQDDRALLWNLARPDAPVVEMPHRWMVMSVEFAPDGQTLLTASEDKTAVVWNLDGSKKRVLNHEHKLWSAAFSADGAYIATAANDHIVRIWPIIDSGPSMTFQGHSDAIVDVAFDPSSRHVLSASSDGSARVWQLHDAKRPVVLRAHEGPVYAVAVSQDGRRLVTGSYDNTARVWNIDNLNAVTEMAALRGHKRGLRSVTFSPDGRFVMTGSMDHSANIWLWESTQSPAVLDSFEGWARSVAFSPDGTLAAVGAGEKGLWLWPADGTGPGRMLPGHRGYVSAIAFSPDGRHLAGAGRDQELTFWDVETGARIATIPGQGEIRALGYHPDGTRIVIGSDDKVIRVWNVDGNGQPLVLKGHDGGVNAASFSPDGQRVVSASDDKTVRLWRADGADAGANELMVLQGHEERIMAAVFTRDGEAIISAGFDHTVRIWRNLQQLSPDTSTVWTATSYCPSPGVRQDLLGIRSELAREGWRACLQKVRDSEDAIGPVKSVE